MFPPIVSVDHRKMAVAVEDQTTLFLPQVIFLFASISYKFKRLIVLANTENVEPVVQSTPLSEGFQLFCNLPIELKLKIWEAALPKDGVFTVDFVATEQETSTGDYQTILMLQNCRRFRGLHGSYGDARPRHTAMRRVCRESSLVYEKQFPHQLPYNVYSLHDRGGCTSPPLTPTTGIFGRLRFCDRDILYINNLKVFLQMDHDILDLERLISLNPEWCFAVRSLRVAIGCLSGELLEDFGRVLDYFTCLERIEVVSASSMPASERKKIIQKTQDKLVEDKGFDAEVPEVVFF
ncbi:uncharacterized protein PAC_11628 [Phialocephala subalpina]|uniref:2EXR domain-containing protein n=1 Tax=Phialocephala subalpina TaxID=576137 RepID=A0A1L7X9N0_9HELO|nr:uncharacterized protein PAC_11628 [Phialocephala subalpina]